MQKIIVLFMSLIFLTGCTNINNNSIDVINNKILSKEIKQKNQYRSGYKYYLPRGLSVLNSSDYNELLTNNKYDFYLYVDIISYNFQTKNTYIRDSKAYYSTELNYKNNYGYLEINLENDKYLVEMMYNYAKIEVMVEKDDIKDVVSNCAIILSSIEYNKNVITNIIGDNNLSATEVDFDIFKTKKKSSNFIKYVEEYDNYKEDEVPDLDLVK